MNKLENDITGIFDAKTFIFEKGEQRGEIRIEYESIEELMRIANKLKDAT